MEKYRATEVEVQATCAKSLENPASGDILLTELTQKERKPKRLAATKKKAKERVKKIISLANFFIALIKNGSTGNILLQDADKEEFPTSY